MENKIFTMSEDGKSEYCCNVVRIGEILPIEGADRIGQTFVNVSESIVVRKDQVKEGDLLFYASNETELNHGFLSANNLFDIGSCELNSNYTKISGILDTAAHAKHDARILRHHMPRIGRLMKRLEKAEDELERSKIQKEADTILYELSDTSTFAIRNGETLKETYERIGEDIAANEGVYNDLRARAKNHVGFFNKYGRVKRIKLKGVPSMGYLFTLDELIKWKPELADANINMEELLNMDFDTIGGELFVKAYIPRVKEPAQRGRSGNKADKKLKAFDRIIPGTFHFHYDTDPLGKNMWKISPTDKVFITNKLHGTSAIFSNVPVKNPKRINFFKRLWNFVTPDSWHFIDYVVENDLLCSSRKVIKNSTINKGVTGGFYNHDIWTEYGELLKPYIPEGITVYGEICGYIDSEKMIQKGYDYCCKPGESFLMPYRMTSLLPDGSTYEWEVSDVMDWTEKLMIVLPDKIKNLDLMYHGTLTDLYPDIETGSHWHEEVYQRLAIEGRFGMEENEPMCQNEVPREGFVLRVEGDKTAEAFKCKCQAFLSRESEMISEIASGKGELDGEMAETY